MLRRPTFKSHLRVQVVDGEGVFLLWETGQALVQGHVYRLIVPYIDGRHTSDEIIELGGRSASGKPIGEIAFFR